MNKKIAVITGASSGLGKEFLRQLLKEENIDEFWIIARRENVLNSIRDMNPDRIRSVPMDLLDPASIKKLVSMFDKEKPDIQVLINSAGMGRVGTAEETSLSDTDRMIDLNCRVTAEMVNICLPLMHEESRIINVSSIAGYMPMPGFSIYAATKAFVQSYSKALHSEVKHRHIHVTCLCPYWVTDTEFIPTAQDTGHSDYHCTLLATKSEFVVRTALRDSRMNMWMSTPGFVTSASRFFTKLVPDAVIVPFMNIIRKI
jgi:short-subunit dehydrogenase